MKNKLLGMLLIVLFVAISSTSITAQNEFLSNEKAVVELSKEFETLNKQTSRTAKSHLKMGCIEKVNYMLQDGSTISEAMDHVFSEKSCKNDPTLNAIRKEVISLLSK